MPSARAAAKTKDWAAVKSQCEAALAKDPWHLDAHRLLATALAQTGDPAAAVDHLVTALAADYYAYGPGLAGEGDDADRPAADDERPRRTERPHDLGCALG